MDIQKTTLSNGLRLLAIPMPSVKSVAVDVIVKAGSRNEWPEVHGLAHFFEHMVFKGTNRHPTAAAIASAADSVGAEMNAGTDKERTSYYLKVMDNHIALAFDILSDFVQSPLLEPEEIEKEKGVILSEIAMYEDLPTRKAPSVFEELLYQGLSLGWDISGKKEDVAKVGREDFVRFLEEFYNPSNMVLTIAGKFDREEVLDLAEHWFGLGVPNFSCSAKLEERSGANLPNSNPSGHPEVKLHTKKTEQSHIVLGVRGNPLAHPDRFAEAILSSILGGGMSSRLFTEVREKRGLAYYIRTELGYYTDNGYLAVRAGVAHSKIEEAIAVILEELSKMAHTAGKLDVSEEEIRKAKEYTKGRLVLGLEDTENVADFFGEQELLEGKITPLSEILEKIDGVTIEDIQRVAQEFITPERLSLAIVGPYEDSERFLKLLEH